MARKKLSDANLEKKQQNPEDIVRSNQELPQPMDSEASMKIESLKSLNQMLLKEEYARRQKIESLLQVNGDLETERNREKSEKEGLVSESVELAEKAARLDLERSVLVVFIAMELSIHREIIERLEMESWDLKSLNDEKESKITNLSGKLSETEVALKNEKEVSSRVYVERDEMRQNLDSKIDEVEKMRASLMAFEERNREVVREMGEMQVAHNSVVSLKAQGDMLIESLKMDKDSLELGLVASDELIRVLNEEIHEVKRKKGAAEEMASVEMRRRKELEYTATEFNEVLTNLQKEEEKLRAVVAELEKRCTGSEVTAKEIEIEIDQLIAERELTEKRMDLLAADKAAIEKDLGEALEKLAGQEHKIEELVNGNSILLVANSRLDSEVGMLHNQVAELKAFTSTLEESSRVDEERIKSLESEASFSKHQFELVTFDRNVMETYLTEEKQKAVALREKVEELEDKVEQGLLAAGKAKAEISVISAENKELKSRLEELKKEMISSENMRAHAAGEAKSLKDRIALADFNNNLVLKMLKQTAVFCSKDGIEVGNENLLGDEPTNYEKIHPFVHEMEMIKTAFRNEETKVETMKKQVGSIQKSADKAQKKSFWALLSTAAALIAAVSVGYASQGELMTTFVCYNN